MSMWLNPRYVSRQLKRPLEGSYENGKMTQEFAVLELLNTDQLEPAQAALAGPGLGPDFVDFIRAKLKKFHREGGADFVRYRVDVPKAVWHRYAKRARLEHRRIRALLVEAIVAQAERIERSKTGEVAGAKLLEDLVGEQRDMAARVERHIERLEKTGGASVPGSGDAARKAIDELKEHARFHGIALAAILTIMNSQKWIPKHLAEQLRKERWLAE